eukprot:150861_1
MRGWVFMGLKGGKKEDKENWPLIMISPDKQKKLIKPNDILALVNVPHFVMVDHNRLEEVEFVGDKDSGDQIVISFYFKWPDKVHVGNQHQKELQMYPEADGCGIISFSFDGAYPKGYVFVRMEGEQDEKEPEEKAHKAVFQYIYGKDGKIVRGDELKFTPKELAQALNTKAYGLVSDWNDQIQQINKAAHREYVNAYHFAELEIENLMADFDYDLAVEQARETRAIQRLKAEKGEIQRVKSRLMHN